MRNKYEIKNRSPKAIATLPYSVLKGVFDFYLEVSAFLESAKLHKKDPLTTFNDTYLGCEYHKIELIQFGDRGPHVCLEKYLDIQGPYCWIRVRDCGGLIFVEPIIQIVRDNDCDVFGNCYIRDIKNVLKKKGGSTATMGKEGAKC